MQLPRIEAHHNTGPATRGQLKNMFKAVSNSSTMSTHCSGEASTALDFNDVSFAVRHVLWPSLAPEAGAWTAGS